MFWWISSGLIFSPLDLMQDVIKSLPCFFNLLLLLFIAICTIVKYSFYG